MRGCKGCMRQTQTLIFPSQPLPCAQAHQLHIFCQLTSHGREGAGRDGVQTRSNIDFFRPLQ
jgi:hypothetical protein